jgi:hypothetical protein
MAARQTNCESSHDLAIHAKSEHDLALISEGIRVLSVATSFDEIKSLRDKAEAVRVFARAANLNLEFQNRAAELKLRAERKAGEVLQKMKLRGGDRKSNSHRDSLKLIDLGITATQSLRWQRESLVPEDEFCRYIASARAEGREITAAGLLTIAAKTRTSGRSVPRKRVAQPNAAVTAATIGEHDTSEIVTELQEHHRLLTDVLQPICKGCSVVDPHIHRVVRYLLMEIGRLLDDLSKCRQCS